MRWKNKMKKRKPIKRKPIPIIGDIKIETKFAWFPTKISFLENIWLEKYEIVHEYKQFKRPIYRYNFCEDGSVCKGVLGEIPTGDYETTKEWVLIRKQYVK